MGHIADLKNPKQIMVVIIVGSRVTVSGGITESLIDITADYSRWGQRHIDILNRAEMKIIEAFALMKINIPIGIKSIDIGAAPGGWTKFLVEKGSNVFAIDAADMDYAMLGEECTVVKHGGQLQKGPRIIHLKMGFDDAIKMLSEERFGFAGIDMNVSPMESAESAARISGLMEPGAPLLMTLKLCKPSDIDGIDNVVKRLNESYEGFIFRKLPHNRQEITMVAHRKAGI
jgi:23S rRNA (cytidine2498-2'-O)-methyltransferase